LVRAVSLRAQCVASASNSRREFKRGRKRDLSQLPVIYLFLDGHYHAARQGSDEKEVVLSAYALLDEG
jgi:hypothetical protein